MNDPNKRQVGGTHYRRRPRQHWDFAAEANLGYFEGVITKYLDRYDAKNGLEDLEKALHYAEKLLSVEGVYQPRTRPAIGDLLLAQEFCALNEYPADVELALIAAVTWRSRQDLEILCYRIKLLIKPLKAEMQGYVNQDR